MGISLALPAAALIALATQSARAQAPVPAPERGPGERHHDGVYVRIALGVSYLHDSYESNGDNVFFGDSKGTITGFGQANELAIGGALAPGLILAGAMVMDLARTTHADYSGEPVHPKDAYVMATFGPMVDYYFDPNAGLHLEAGGGLGIVSGVQPEGVDGGGGTGFGLFCGVGNEWWIAKQWALGGLLRLHYVSAHESEFAIFDTLRVDHRALGVALLFDATFN